MYICTATHRNLNYLHRGSPSTYMIQLLSSYELAHHQLAFFTPGNSPFNAISLNGNYGPQALSVSIPSLLIPCNGKTHSSHLEVPQYTPPSSSNNAPVLDLRWLTGH